MSPAGPLPDPPGRRRWVWIVLGILGACLLICVLIVVWGSTIGSETLNQWATQVSDEATRQASGGG